MHKSTNTVSHASIHKDPKAKDETNRVEEKRLKKEKYLLLIFAVIALSSMVATILVKILL